MARTETIRQVAERYASEHSHFAFGKTVTGKDFASRIRLRFSGDRRTLEIQKIFRDHCHFVSTDERDNRMQMEFDWNEPGRSYIGDLVFGSTL